jgi:hypothetical protein
MVISMVKPKWMDGKDVYIKRWNLAFNAQGSRIIIIVVQVGAVKIYVVAALEVLKKNERKMKLNLPQKSIVFWVSTPPPSSNANVLFGRVFFDTHPLYDQTQGSGAVISFLYGEL